jgi:hypothetical protein
MEEEGSIGCQKNSCKKKAGIEKSMDKLSWITQPKKKKPTNKSKAKARDLQTLNEPLNKPCRDWREESIGCQKNSCKEKLQ